MTYRIDTCRSREFAAALQEILIDDMGLTNEEIIPACVQTIVDVADEDDELLDVAANFLADGGVIPEDEPDTWEDDAPDWEID